MAAASLAAWFAGGGRELAPRELGDLLTAIKPTQFFRTGASSAAVTSGGDGHARYRVVTLAAKSEHARARAAIGGQDRSFMAGRLLVRQESIDGGESRIALTAVNNNDTGISSAACFVRLAKSGGERPWVQGATLSQAADLGTEWECRLQFDLPPKSTMRALVGVGSAPLQTEIDVKIDIPSRLQSAAKLGEDGLVYWTSATARGAITLQNMGVAAVECSPLARFDGEVVAWKAPGQVDEFVASARLTLPPGGVQQLQLDLSAARVVPGSRSLVFYVNDGRSLTPVEARVEVVQERGAAP